MVSNIYEINFTDINFDPQKKPKRIVSCEDAIEEIGMLHFTLNPAMVENLLYTTALNEIIIMN